MQNANSFPPVFWRRLDVPGCESARLIALETGWSLEGSTVFADSNGPCRLDYQITCDTGWRTRSAHVAGWVGEQLVDISITVNADQVWQLNDSVIPQVAGCLDVDLNFSPSTNLLPIRRLQLRQGASATLVAAWLRFPSFNLEPLQQAYHRTGERAYHYESAGGAFTAELNVNPLGFVIDYPPFWTGV